MVTYLGVVRNTQKIVVQQSFDMEASPKVTQMALGDMLDSSVFGTRYISMIMCIMLLG